MRAKPLGQLLVARGVLTPEQLREALELQRRSGRRLATECQAQGFAREGDLLTCLSDQAGVPGVGMARLVFPLSVLDWVPETVAVGQKVLPVRAVGERLFLAMANPTDTTLISELAFVSNRRVVGVVALEGLLQQVITEAYAAKRSGALEYRGPAAGEGEVPLEFVVPRDLTVVPDELVRPAELQGGESPQGPFGQSSDELLIDIDEDSPADLALSLEDDEIPIFTEELASEAPDALSEGAPHEAVADEQTGPKRVPPPGLRRAAAAVDPEDQTGPKRVPPPGWRRGAASERASQLRVLVVDDDPELRQLVARLLRSRRMEVQEAGRGLEALNLLKTSPPDLVVLDAMLPEIHGFDICRKIKSSRRYGQIPVIMISSVYRGWRIARDLRDAYGVDAFLEKPFTIDQLWTTVDRILAGRRAAAAPDGSTADEAYRDCLRLFRAGDLDGAIERCKEGVAIDPLSAKLHFRLGSLFLKKKGRMYHALQELEEAVMLDPELFAAQRALAILYQRRGFKNKAIDMWERALRSSPSDEMRDRIREHLRRMI